MRTLESFKPAGCHGACLESQLLGRLKQEDPKFKVSLGYIEIPCLKIKK
jgi:hypothetical protein